MAFADPVDLICYETEMELEQNVLGLERLCSLYQYLVNFQEQYPENTELTAVAVESIGDTLDIITLEDIGLLDELVAVEALGDGLSVAKNIGNVLAKVIKAVLSALKKIYDLLGKVWDRFLGAAASRLKEAQTIASEINLTKREMVIDPRDDKIKFKDSFQTVLDYGRGDSAKPSEIINNIEMLIKSTNPEKAQRMAYDAILQILDYQNTNINNPLVIKDISNALWTNYNSKYDVTRVIDDKDKTKVMIKIGHMPQAIVVTGDKPVSKPPKAELKIIKRKKLPKECTALSPEDAHDIINVAVQLLSITRDETDTYNLKKELDAVTQRVKDLEKGKDKPDPKLIGYLPQFVNFSKDFTKACAGAKLAVGKDIISYVRASSYAWKRK
ncbi:hypothetical protein [Vibrio phage BONAISHI]|nr:hypothetical protein [Vibrio phage BONAISHI]